MNSDNPTEIFPEVNEQGEVIGSLSRKEAHCGTKRLHPVVHLHVFNAEGDLYLQKRPSWKDIQPNKWDTAVGGHVDWGETIEEALLREAQEELHISALGAEPLGAYVFESQRERELINAFRITSTEAIEPDEEELQEGRFFSFAEIAERLGTGFFTPNFEQEYKRLFLSE